MDPFTSHHPHNMWNIREPNRSEFKSNSSLEYLRLTFQTSTISYFILLCVPLLRLPRLRRINIERFARYSNTYFRTVAREKNDINSDCARYPGHEEHQNINFGAAYSIAFDSCIFTKSQLTYCGDRWETKSPSTSPNKSLYLSAIMNENIRINSSVYFVRFTTHTHTLVKYIKCGYFLHRSHGRFFRCSLIRRSKQAIYPNE